MIARGLARVKIQATVGDGALIRALAETLRGDPEKADQLRSTLRKALVERGSETAFDVFGSDLPDEAFSGIFDQSREKGWRETRR